MYADEEVAYKPGEMVSVKCGVAIGIPSGCVGLVRDRSGFSKTGLKVTAGVIDCGYTGELVVMFLNLSGEHGCIHKGAKIAQLLIMPVSLMPVVEVESLEQTSRGDKGFGSTGV